jgi:serralysin
MLPVYSYQQIAHQLTDAYWEDQGLWRHSFNSSTITYNIQGLTSAGRALATSALQRWADVTGLNFVATTGSAKITFDDSDSGAYSDFYLSGSRTTSANVNVSTQWVAAYGTGVNSYSFQTYLHEIGHALGLGHAGNYNGNAYWSTTGRGGNLFLNDSWQATVMSYFSQDENTYVNATEAFVAGPMIADIIAIQDLYGVPTNVRAGATTYGFGSTAGSFFDFSNYNQHDMVAFAIFDSGGTDTLNASGFSANQLLDLRAGRYSNIGGEVGNIGIAVNTTIENAVGGTGNDMLIGNNSSNYLNGHRGADKMTGYGGNDFYTVDSGGDVVTEAAGGGSDTVRSYISYTLGANVEHLKLWGTAAINGTGNTLNNTITGNGAANVLNGGSGNDTLIGGAGNDTLTGGAGNDYFVFNAGLNASNNVDRILDFSVVNDIVRLENAVFTALGAATGVLSAAMFWKSTSGTAHDSSDRIIYETDSGKLFYDSNGSAAGGSTHFATLAAGLALTNADFAVI